MENKQSSGPIEQTLSIELMTHPAYAPAQVDLCSVSAALARLSSVVTVTSSASSLNITNRPFRVFERFTVWNSLHDNVRNSAVGPDQFRRTLKTHPFACC